MFHKMNVKRGSKDLKQYPQISRRVRGTTVGPSFVGQVAVRVGVVMNSHEISPNIFNCFSRAGVSTKLA